MTSGDCRDPLRIAVVGFGRAGADTHVPAWMARSDCRVVAVADVSALRLKKARHLIPGVATFESITTLLHSSDDIDIIDICTPPADHADHVYRALMTDNHVVCEKPVALRRDQAEQLVSLARYRALMLYPGHNYRFSPGIRTLLDIVRRGEIGAITSLLVNIERDTSANGTPEWRPNWRRDRMIAGGGVWVDHGAHVAYLAALLVGADLEGVSMRCDSLHRGVVDERVEALLVFGGIPVTVSLSWRGPARTTLYRLVGTQGDVTLIDDTIHLTRLDAPDQTITVISDFGDGRHRSWFTSLAADVVTRSRIGAMSPVWVDEIQIVASVIEAGYESARHGGSWLEVSDEWP